MNDISNQHQTPNPRARSQSPSPDISPRSALSPCPPLERSLSGCSSVASSVSARSTSGQLSDAGGGRRRGYIRPQATDFADSARNRDSVMSLGSIAHLQYYFARTGLLDGKGGQFAPEQSKDALVQLSDPNQPHSEAWAALQSPVHMTHYREQDDVESPSENSSVVDDWPTSDAMPLPPTYSTYKQKPTYVPPPPDLTVLRRELREALQDVKKLLAEIRASNEESSANNAQSPKRSAASKEQHGWHEIQGLQVLDLVTLAIRAAKNYYTAHEQPQRLYAIKSERHIRADLYAVLDVLKRLATRNFSGGIRTVEIEKINDWSVSIMDLLRQEEQAETKERQERENWIWRSGDWAGRERQREWLFLKSFDTDPEPLVEWKEKDTHPSPFLMSLRSGLRLVRLHNKLVKASKRQFEEIRSFHVDTAKPYRCAENLRYWIKAAELRWDVKLEVDVLAVVQGEDAAAWQAFDEAILLWCRTVRTELVSEWNEQKQQAGITTPHVQTEEVGKQTNLVY